MPNDVPRILKARIQKKLREHEERKSRLEKVFQEEAEKIRTKPSIREFVLSKKPKDEVQMILAIGYYLEEYDGLASFNVRDLEDGFRRAREKVPDNINYKVIRNVQKNHMMEAKDKKNNRKAWYLTNQGRDYVENNSKGEK